MIRLIGCAAAAACTFTLLLASIGISSFVSDTDKAGNDREEVVVVADKALASPGVTSRKDVISLLPQSTDKAEPAPEPDNGTAEAETPETDSDAEGEWEWYPEDSEGEEYESFEQSGPAEYWFTVTSHDYGSQAAIDAGGISEFQPGYYASHYYDDGAIWQGFQVGDIVHIDGYTITLEGCLYTTYYSNLSSVRNQVGWDTVCMQTCLGEGSDIIIWYGTVPGAYFGLWGYNGYSWEALQSEKAQLDAEKIQLDSEFDSVYDGLEEAYLSEDDGLIEKAERRVARYEADVDDYNARVDEYNSKVG